MAESGIQKISQSIILKGESCSLKNPIILTGVDTLFVELAAEIIGHRLKKRVEVLEFDDSETFRAWKSGQKTEFFSVLSGKEYSISNLSDKLTDFGYEKVSRVWRPGEFSLYGDVVIAWIDGYNSLIRLSFYDKSIESIDLLDPELRHSIKKAERIDFPSRSSHDNGSIESSKRAHFKRYIGNELESERLEIPIVYIDKEYFRKEDREILRESYEFLDLDIKVIPGGDYVCGNSKALERLVSEYADRGYKVKILIEQNELNSVAQSRRRKPVKKINNILDIVISDRDIIAIGNVPRKGFISATSKIMFLTEYEISGQVEVDENAKDFFGKIEIGDYVVHEDHGIGIYSGIEKGKNGFDYLVISYADNDRLLVPYKAARKLAKFLGGKKVKPKITKLSGGSWKRTTKSVKEDTDQIARELLQLYSMRQLVKAPQLIKGSDDVRMYDEFIQSFEHDDTEDQVMASKVIAEDLKKKVPMDRLLIGDVGFGKTEIAARAIFAAINAGCQAVMLAPTTVLVEQHKAVLQERFSHCGDYVIESISRLVSKSSQEQIIQKLAAGKIDLIIGTHSLLSDRIELKTPGLIVIDEEQKFGVKHKEKIKALRLNAHTLSMTATPIPRTLHMSLSGIRDISVIATPPPGRKPIINKSHIFNWDIVQQAIAKEMVREGQVYYLHNRVATIDKTALKIQELFPQKRVDVVHGRMAASHLASVMQRFARKEIDILVCTTIVENGLDLANVNTLIIDDVEKL
ncbi:DEAD/DEAH box helicase, partial [Candidatus Dojkabacteria bacterium]|nr:DEAD/DEAH box helicase [Candidatus Dojkabacteria bacterium]